MATASKLRSLAAFSACDISDALLKLKVPAAGFLADLVPFAPHGLVPDKLRKQPKLVAAASTVLLVPKDGEVVGENRFEEVQESNIPAGAHYVDLTKPDTVVVMSQPPAQRCSVLGGIMGLRMKTRGAKGVIVGGRIRDLNELRSLDFPVWALATSVVSTGAEARPWAIDVPITIQGVRVTPGDIVFGDPVEGVVVVPQDKLDEVLDILPKLTEADEKVMEDVRSGSTVKESFAKHRDSA